MDENIYDSQSPPADRTKTPGPTVEKPKIPGTPIVEKSTPNQAVEKKEPLPKYLAYFFLGLILSVLGLFIGFNWIILKGKQNKRWKLIFLMLGFILSFIIWTVVAGGFKFWRSIPL